MKDQNILKNFDIWKRTERNIWKLEVTVTEIKNWVDLLKNRLHIVEEILS